MAFRVKSPSLSMHATPDVHVAAVHGKAAAAMQCSLACPCLVLVCAVSRAAVSSTVRGSSESVARITLVQIPPGPTIMFVEFMIMFPRFTLPWLIPLFPDKR